MELIKVLNKSAADKLAAQGFKYITQRLNDEQDVYVFFGTPELMRLLCKDFSNREFFIGRTLNF